MNEMQLEQRFFARCFEKAEVLSCYAMFSKLPHFSLITAEKRFFMFCHTFRSICVSIIQIFDVIRHYIWVNLVQRVLKTLFLQEPQKKEVKRDKFREASSPFHITSSFNL